MFKVGVIRYICTFTKIGVIQYRTRIKMESFGTKLLKGGLWVNTPRNTCKMRVIGNRFAKRGSMSTKRLNLLKYIILIMLMVYSLSMYQ